MRVNSNGWWCIIVFAPFFPFDLLSGHKSNSTFRSGSALREGGVCVCERESKRETERESDQFDSDKIHIHTCVCVCERERDRIRSIRFRQDTYEDISCTSHI